MKFKKYFIMIPVVAVVFVVGSFFLKSSSKNFTKKNTVSKNSILKINDLSPNFDNLEKDLNHKSENELYASDPIIKSTNLQTSKKEKFIDNRSIKGFYDDRRKDPQVVRNQISIAYALEKKELEALHSEVKFDNIRLEEFLIKGEDESVAYLQDIIAQKKLRIEKLELAGN